MNQPSSLKDLVELAIQRHGTSARQLGFQAQRQGFRLAGTTLNHLRAGTYKSVPTADTIRAIAWLAGVSDEVAFTAAGQPVPGPPFADELPPGIDNLPPKARKALIEMARVLIDAHQDVSDASNTQDKPAADNPSGDDLAGRRRARQGQKTVTTPEEGATNRAVREDEIPLPENWRDLAAGAPHESQQRREREWSELGEESQDLSGDD